MSALLVDEPISTISQPLPLPPYQSDPNLSEDDNLLIWVSILARHSSSKKGHMGTIFVRPPEKGDPSDPSSTCLPPLSSRIAAYANNTPLLFARHSKGVPEIHAEALAISRSAANGVPLAGCTVYISFPPCNECFKLLVGAQIKRCAFKKGILPGEGKGDAVLVAAETHGIEMAGTLDKANFYKGIGNKEAEVEARQQERKGEEVRDAKVRAFWESQGEDATKTRTRVNRWWDDWMHRYKAAEKVVKVARGWQNTKRADNGTMEEDDEQEDDLDTLINGAATSVVPAKRPKED